MKIAKGSERYNDVVTAISIAESLMTITARLRNEEKKIDQKIEEAIFDLSSLYVGSES